MLALKTQNVPLVGYMCPIAQQGPEARAYGRRSFSTGKESLGLLRDRRPPQGDHDGRPTGPACPHPRVARPLASAPKRAQVLGRQVFDQPRLKAVSVGTDLQRLRAKRIEFRSTRLAKVANDIQRALLDGLMKLVKGLIWPGITLDDLRDQLLATLNDYAR